MPYVAIDGKLRKRGSSATGQRAKRHPGSAISQVDRKRIAKMFRCDKAPGRLAQVKPRGLAKVTALVTPGLAAYGLIRLPKLLGAPPSPRRTRVPSSLDGELANPTAG